jgi:carbonic anhydrase
LRGAACDVVTKNATYPGVKPIIPAALAVRDAPGDFVVDTAKESERRTAARLTQVSPLLADLVSSGRLKIGAAIYDLETGVVAHLR